MASETTALNYIAKALWDPRPTETDEDCQNLAFALGYPEGWRVVRKIEDGGIIVDRIYAGEPDTGCDTWFNHEGAMSAAATWEDSNKTPFAYKGGHLLPIQPRFAKGDKVQVMYEGDWWDAKILKRKEYPGQYKYQVFYPTDSSKQGGVEEYLIRPKPAEVDPEQTAIKLGFMEGWKAKSTGHNRWHITSPDGQVYGSKKKAMEALQAMLDAATDEGDPPWRTTGHEYLGRRVKWSWSYRVSARRTVDIDQLGTVTGWISENDLDSEGQPGFVSEKTGKPAPLFHVKFDDNPKHLYASQLLIEQDLEEYEIFDCLLPIEEKQKEEANKSDPTETTTTTTVAD